MALSCLDIARHYRLLLWDRLRLMSQKPLLSKKQMNKHLGKNRSMDLLDACSMRMLPVLDAEYGEELMYGVQEVYEDESNIAGRESIYDDTTWA